MRRAEAEGGGRTRQRLGRRQVPRARAVVVTGDDKQVVEDVIVGHGGVRQPGEQVGERAGALVLHAHGTRVDDLALRGRACRPLSPVVKQAVDFQRRAHRRVERTGTRTLAWSPVELVHDVLGVRQERHTHLPVAVWGHVDGLAEVCTPSASKNVGYA